MKHLAKYDDSTDGVKTLCGRPADGKGYNYYSNDGYDYISKDTCKVCIDIAVRLNNERTKR